LCLNCLHLNYYKKLKFYRKPLSVIFPFPKVFATRKYFRGKLEQKSLSSHIWTAKIFEIYFLLRPKPNISGKFLFSV
jgi:hypothetical protein